MELTKEQFEESMYLDRQLDNMQYDLKLPRHQRKMANDAVKAIILFPEYPMVYSDFYRGIIRAIKEAKEYQELECLKR